MSRLTRAAETLIAQVQTRDKRVKAVRASEPDGLRVVRSISFSKSVGEWLEPLLAEIKDTRIERTDWEGARFVVTFSAGPRADFSHPFPLDAAQTVLGG